MNWNTSELTFKIVTRDPRGEQIVVLRAQQGFSSIMKDGKR